MKSVPTDRTLAAAVERFSRDAYDFILVGTPPGGNSLVDIASRFSDLVLIPTGVFPLDMKRTQAMLDAFHGTDTPVAVVLVNVDKRENLLDLA